jgi:hypothetical protein
MTTSRRMLVGRGEGVNGALVEEEGTKVGGRIMPPSTGSVGAGFRDGAPARERDYATLSQPPRPSLVLEAVVPAT